MANVSEKDYFPISVLLYSAKLVIFCEIAESLGFQRNHNLKVAVLFYESLCQKWNLN